MVFLGAARSLSTGGSVFLLLTILGACSGLSEMALDGPFLRDDMVRRTLDGELFIIRRDDISEILILMEDDQADYRRAAVMLAGQSGSSELRPSVLRAVLDPDSAVSDQAMEVIKADLRAYRPLIEKNLKDPDPVLRKSGLTVLAEVGNESLLPRIVELFSDSNEDVRNQASITAGALAQSDNSRLASALEDPDPTVRALAYRALGYGGGADNAQKFIMGFSDPDHSVRREALVAARHMSREGLPALHQVIIDPQQPYRLRLSALDVIQGIRSPDSLKLLMDLLDSDDERISMKAASILNTYGAEAIPELALLYEQEDETNRKRILTMMREIGDPAALPSLAEALEDPSHTVRETAAASLKPFGVEAFPVLRSALGAEASRRAALTLLRDGGDSWLGRDEDNEVNEEVLLLLLRESTRQELLDWLDKVEFSVFFAENLLSLKEALETGPEFRDMEEQIATERDSYLYAWRQHEKNAAASRETLQRSFELLHGYFETLDESLLEQSKTIRKESRRLEDTALRYKTFLENLSPEEQADGRMRLADYTTMREKLVRIWEYTGPEFRELAEAVYEGMDLDPHTLVRENTLLE